MPDSKARGVSNLPVAIPDTVDAPTVSATNVGTSQAYNNGAATVAFSNPTGGRPTSYSITTSPATSTTAATSSPATISGLSSATSYTVSVSASNSVNGTSASSTSSSFTATTVPQAPTIGTFTDGGTGTSGTLSFTAGATGGSTITGYKYSTDGTTYSAASGTTSPFTISGLTVGSYTFYLKATNANGDSAASSGVSGTIITPPSYESIATVTVGAGGSSSISFSSIPSTFKHLQIRGIVACTVSGTDANSITVSANSDTTPSNYYYHWLYGTGSAVGTVALNTYGGYTTQGVASKTGATNTFGALVIDILDYANTSKYKTFRGLSGTDMNNTSGQIGLTSGLWMNTSAISSLSINVTYAGNLAQYSSFALYGIKG
jgi:hypothetical protein